jgi:threonine/homoserine/homoserine lactone efflux protein
VIGDVIGELLPGANQAAAFAVAVFILNATPGVDLVLTVSRTLQRGARAGIAAALGINAGCVLHALAAAFGLAALLALYPQAFTAVQWAGAAYLVWLGVGMLRQAIGASAAPQATATTQGPKQTHSLWVDFRTGLLTNVLNPKVAFFFLAFLPQFVPAASPNKTLSFLLLGAWFVVQGFVFLLGLVVAASYLSRLGTHLGASNGLQRVLNACGGVFFIALALRLLREKPVTA